MQLYRHAKSRKAEVDAVLNASHQGGPTFINANNKSAIAIASTSNARTKHIDIQYHYVREKTQDGTVAFIYISRAEMAADGLKKALVRVKYERWVAARSDEQWVALAGSGSF